MKRADLIHLMLTATTREEVAHAQALRDEWLKNHPDDDQVYEASGQLEMMAEGYALDDAKK